MTKGYDYPGVSIVFLCHDGNGNFLMAKRSENCRDEHGRWDPGAGALEFGERVEEALIREVCEEYGVKPLRAEFLGMRDVHRVHQGYPTHWIALDYLVVVRRDDVRNAEPHKHDEIGWFQFGNFPFDTHSQWSAFLSKYRERLELIHD